MRRIKGGRALAYLSDLAALALLCGSLVTTGPLVVPSTFAALLLALTAIGAAQGFPRYMGLLLAIALLARLLVHLVN